MTIKQLTYILSFFLLVCFSAHDLLGQVKDFQSWWELELDKKISGRLDLNGELEQRFKNNSLQYSRTLFTLGASYDLADYFRLAGGARVIFLRDPEQRFHTRYRFHMEGTGSYDLSGFDLSLRYMLEDEFNVSNPMQLHIVVLGYAYRF